MHVISINLTIYNRYIIQYYKTKYKGVCLSQYRYITAEATDHNNSLLWPVIVDCQFE